MIRCENVVIVMIIAILMFTSSSFQQDSLVWPTSSHDSHNTRESPYDSTHFSPLVLPEISPPGFTSHHTAKRLGTMSKTWFMPKTVVIDAADNIYTHYLQQFNVEVFSFHESGILRWKRTVQVNSMMNVYTRLSLIRPAESTVFSTVVLATIDQLFFFASDTGRLLQTINTNTTDFSSYCNMAKYSLPISELLPTQLNGVFGMTLECGTRIGLVQNPDSDTYAYYWRDFQTVTDYYYSDVLAISSKSIFAVAHRNSTSRSVVNSYVIAIDYASNFKEPSLLWHFNASMNSNLTFAGDVLGNPVLSIDEKQLFVGLLDSFTVVSFDTTTGELLWATDRLLKTGCTAMHKDLAIFNSKSGDTMDPILYAFTVCGHAFAIDGFTGDIIWSKIIIDGMVSHEIPPLVSQSGLIVNQLHFENNSNVHWQVKKLDLKLGTLLWSFPFYRYPTKPAINVGDMGSMSLSSHGMLFFETAIHEDKIQRLGQIKLSSVAPRSLYSAQLGEKGSVALTLHLIQANGTQELLKAEKISCIISVPIFFPDKSIQFDGAISDSDQVVCKLMDVQSKLPFSPPKDNPIPLMVSIRVAGFQSNALAVLVHSDMTVTDATPKAMPVGTQHSLVVSGDYTNIVQQNNGRQTNTAFCAYFDTASGSEEIVPGRVADSNNLICQPPNTYTGRKLYTLFVCIPLASSESKVHATECQYFFPVPSFVLLIYEPPTFTSIRNDLLPVGSKSTIQLTGTGFEDVFLVLQQQMYCQFDSCSGAKVTASCKKNEDDTVGCACSIPSTCTLSAKATTKDVPISFSEDGTFFNSTRLSITVYNQPKIVSIDPKYGNYSGGTLCKIQGSGFFPSHLLSCQFGDMRVNATYNQTDTIYCLSPALYISPRELSGVTVSVTMSENRQDFIFPALSFKYIIEQDCPEKCLHGHCDIITGRCVCNPGWGGAACDNSNQYDKITQWVWIGIMCISLVGSALFVTALCSSFVYFSHRSKQYQRLLQERKQNDISTSL